MNERPRSEAQAWKAKGVLDRIEAISDSLRVAWTRAQLEAEAEEFTEAHQTVISFKHETGRLPWVHTAAELNLTPGEVNLLRQGIEQLGGRSGLPDGFARAIGFDGTHHFVDTGARAIDYALETEGGLADHDWTRALLVAELCFASDIVGVGVEWSTVTGVSDDETIRLLRSLQRKFVGVRSSVYPR